MHLVLSTTPSVALRRLAETLLLPGRFGGGVAAGHAAEGQAFTDTAGSLVQIAVDRTELAGAVACRLGARSGLFRCAGGRLGC